MNEEINQLEQYIFAKDKHTFLENLIKDTESHYYFSLLEAIENKGVNLTQAQEEDLKRYRKFRTQSSKGIRVRYLFRKYDQADTESKKKQIIAELNSKLFKVPDVLSQNFGDNLIPTSLRSESPRIQQQQNIRRPSSSEKSSNTESDIENEIEKCDSSQSALRSQDEEMEHQNAGSQEENENMNQEENENMNLFGSDELEDIEIPIEQNDENEPLLEKSPSEMNIEEKKELPTVLDSSILDVEKVSNKSLWESMRSLNSDNVIRIPIKIVLAETIFKNIEKYLSQVDIYQLSCAELKSILQHYQLLLYKNKKNHDHEMIWHFNKMTLEQIQDIKQYMPDLLKNKNYVKYFFLKSFDLTKLKILKGQPLIDFLKSIHSWTQTLKPKFHSLNDQVIFEILYQGINCNSISFQLFLKIFPIQNLN